MTAQRPQPTISTGATVLLVAGLIVLLCVLYAVLSSNDQPSYICSRAPEMVSSTVCVTTP